MCMEYLRYCKRYILFTLSLLQQGEEVVTVMSVLGIDGLGSLTAYQSSDFVFVSILVFISVALSDTAACFISELSVCS